MKRTNKNVALLEYGGSHTECMFAQVKALIDNGYRVFLMCNKSLISEFQDLSVFEDILLLTDTGSRKPTDKERLRDAIEVQKFTWKHKTNTIIINTMENRFVRYLLLLPLPRVKNYVGIVHDLDYFHRSSFKLFSHKIKKLFVLNDFLLNEIKGLPDSLTFSSFYPIFFPQHNIHEVTKLPNEFWFCNPGGTDKERKALKLLVDSLKQKRLSDNIKVIILGNNQDENKLLEKIETLPDKDKFILFCSHIPPAIFDAYMRKADIIIPLVHPEIYTNFYGNHRTSGSFNLAYAYKKPLMLEESIRSNYAEFDEISIPYKFDNIVDRLNEIATSPQEYKDSLHKIENHPYLNVDKQSSKFIELIEK